MSDAAEFQKEFEWRREVKARGVCVCGNTEHLAAFMIVPEESGGLRTPENGVLLCRACALARHVLPTEGARRPFQCLLSTDDHTALTEWADSAGHSRASWVRTLMALVVSTPEAYPDLSLFQGEPAAEGVDMVRVNLPLDVATYNAFEKAVAPLSVVAALRALIRMRKDRDGHN